MEDNEEKYGGVTKDVIHRFIDSERLAVFGTVTPGGHPQAALVGIAITPGFEIIFDTVRSSRKFQNLIQNPVVSFVIGCAGPISVQYEGEARELGGAELKPYREIYFAKWPDGPSRLNWPEITYIAVRPHWLRYMDYSATPPVIEELAFAFK